PQMISGFVFLPYYTGGIGIGLGGRYTMPIIDQGWISQLNDSVELEFGADVFYDSYPYAFGYSYSFFGLGVPIEGRWTFHITDKFSAYGKVGAGIALYFGNSGCVNCGYSLVNPYFTGNAGVLFK